jgi:hypothetical protein
MRSTCRHEWPGWPGLADEESEEAREYKYRGTSLIRKRNPLEPYSQPMPRDLGKFWGSWRLLVGEVPL